MKEKNDAFKPVHEKAAIEKQEMIYPANLDVVMIDGKWAQILSAPIKHAQKLFTIRFLSGQGPIKHINFDDLSTVRKINICVGDVGIFGFKFNQDELDKIYWGPETEKKPELKKEVMVFAEYQSIKTKKRHEK